MWEAAFCFPLATAGWYLVLVRAWSGCIGWRFVCIFWARCSRRAGRCVWIIGCGILVYDSGHVYGGVWCVVCGLDMAPSGTEMGCQLFCRFRMQCCAVVCLCPADDSAYHIGESLEPGSTGDVIICSTVQPAPKCPVSREKIQSFRPHQGRRLELHSPLSSWSH